MEDKEIVSLYFARDERAVQATEEKYHGFCHKIAWNILRDKEDSEECVNDTWFSVWNSIPPQKPERLDAFCGKITRNHAIDCLRRRFSVRRMDAHIADIEGELKELGGVPDTAEETVLHRELAEQIDRFLLDLPQQERILCRCLSVKMETGRMQKQLISSSVLKHPGWI